GIELLDKEVELKDDVWEKVVEVMAVIEAETRIEEFLLKPLILMISSQTCI
ncbi:Hypothetical predicted protein, partial [Olea europaea subsp. europaea]